MTATFCGHSSVERKNDVKAWLYKVIDDLIRQGCSQFYLGGYGDFDNIAASVLYDLKSKASGITSTLVLPYPDRKADTHLYDNTVYPPLENVPKRYAILKRNQWMVDNSDIIVTYITHDWGGAYQTYKYAVKKNKTVLEYHE